jgi:restriction endonuclease S subunit
MAVWSVVDTTELFGALRLDAEFYQPLYRENDLILRMFPKYTTLGQICSKFSKGIFDIKAAEYVESGIPFVRISNLRSGIVEEDNLVFITPEQHQKQAKTALRKYDVILSKTAYPAASLVQLDDCNVSQDTIAIKTTRSQAFNVYLVVFLNTRFGLTQMQRLFQGNIQTHLSLEDARTIVIPELDEKFQLEVQFLFEASIQRRTEAKSLYAQAEALLLRELGLDTLDLSHQTTFTATFSEVMEARRLDAEYFQPKYTHLIAAIQNTGQAVRLGNWVSETIRRGILPDYVEDGDITVINSQHVGKTHVELDDNRTTSRAFTQVSKNMRAVVKKYDVLLNSTGYITIGRAQTLLDDVEAVVDGHVSIIRPKQGLDPVYLGLYLNSLPGQLQTERGWTGSSGQIELRPEVVSEYVIWKAPEPVQQQIRQLVETSHQARKEASQLLEQAKQRVEELILEGN